MKHYASPRFWALYKELPVDVRTLADKNYEFLKTDPKHPSLHFKRIGKLWSARVGDHYRVLGHDVPDGVHGLVLTRNTTSSYPSSRSKKS